MNLGLFKLSLLIRLTRAGVREALAMDYVKFARGQRLPASRVVGVHVLKNIMIPIVTVIGLEFGSVVAFAVVTEVFCVAGDGQAADRLDQRAGSAGNRGLSADHSEPVRVYQPAG